MNQGYSMEGIWRTRPVAVTYDDGLQDMSEIVMADATKQVSYPVPHPQVPHQFHDIVGDSLRDMAFVGEPPPALLLVQNSVS